LPAAVDGILARGLAVDPADRFQSAEELLEAVRSAISPKIALEAPAGMPVSASLFDLPSGPEGPDTWSDAPSAIQLEDVQTTSPEVNRPSIDPSLSVVVPKDLSRLEMPALGEVAAIGHGPAATTAFRARSFALMPLIAVGVLVFSGVLTFGLLLLNGRGARDEVPESSPSGAAPYAVPGKAPPEAAKASQPDTPRVAPPRAPTPSPPPPKATPIARRAGRPPPPTSARAPAEPPRAASEPTRSPHSPRILTARHAEILRLLAIRGLGFDDLARRAPGAAADWRNLLAQTEPDPRTEDRAYQALVDTVRAMQVQGFMADSRLAKALSALNRVSHEARGTAFDRLEVRYVELRGSLARASTSEEFERIALDAMKLERDVRALTGDNIAP
jgi:hypothetical protein